MANHHQWSIRRMLLWVFIAALVLSHVSNFYQSKIVGFTNFAVDGNEINEWISQIDPTANIYTGSDGSDGSGDSFDSDIDYNFATEDINSEELLDLVRNSFREKANREGWAIIRSSEGGDSFGFGLSKGASRFRVWCWVLPVQDSEYADILKQDGKFATRLKILQMGYRIR